MDALFREGATFTLTHSFYFTFLLLLLFYSWAVALLDLVTGICRWLVSPTIFFYFSCNPTQRRGRKQALEKSTEHWQVSQKETQCNVGQSDGPPVCLEGGLPHSLSGRLWLQDGKLQVTAVGGVGGVGGRAEEMLLDNTNTGLGESSLGKRGNIVL